MREDKMDLPSTEGSSDKEKWRDGVHEGEADSPLWITSSEVLT